MSRGNLRTLRCAAEVGCTNGVGVCQEAIDILNKILQTTCGVAGGISDWILQGVYERCQDGGVLCGIVNNYLSIDMSQLTVKSDKWG